jgi:hypothetical protein
MRAFSLCEMRLSGISRVDTPNLAPFTAKSEEPEMFSNGGIILQEIGDWRLQGAAQSCEIRVSVFAYEAVVRVLSFMRQAAVRGLRRGVFFQ